MLEEGFRLLHNDVDGGGEGGGACMGEVLNNCNDEMPEQAAASAVATVLVKGHARTPKMASGLSEDERRDD